MLWAPITLCQNVSMIRHIGTSHSGVQTTDPVTLLHWDPSVGKQRYNYKSLTTKVERERGSPSTTTTIRKAWLRKWNKNGNLPFFSNSSFRRGRVTMFRRQSKRPHILKFAQIISENLLSLVQSPEMARVVLASPLRVAGTDCARRARRVWLAAMARGDFLSVPCAMQT